MPLTRDVRTQDGDAGFADTAGSKHRWMRWCADALLILALLAGFFVLTKGTVSWGPYNYDEADYMYAISKGVLANWSDTPTLSLPEFIRLGIEEGMRPDQRSALSERVRNAGDIVFYRHHHGPFYYYWLLAVSGTGTAGEHTMRVVTLLFHLLTFLVIYFGCLWLRPGTVGRLTAVLCSLVYLWSFANIKTASEIAPHSAFVFCYISALLLLCKMLETGERRYWYGAVVAAALAFCALEVSFVLVLTLIISLFVKRRTMLPDAKWREWRNFSARSVALFVGVVVLVWPAALLKLSFIKAYLFMGYLAVFRKTPWANLTLAETWISRFTASPVEWGFVVLSLLVAGYGWRLLKGISNSWVFVCFGGLMILACLRVTSADSRYMAPFFPALQLFSGFILAAAISGFRPVMRYLVVGALAVLLFWSARRQFEMTVPNFEREAALIAYVKDHGLQDRTVLVQSADLPLLHYYFPHMRLRGFVDEQEIPGLINGVDGILYTSVGMRFNPL